MSGRGGADGQAQRHVAMARWLAWGLLVAGLVQLAVQWPALRAAGLLGRRGGVRALPPGAPGPGEVLRRSAPLALGAAVYQINVMVDGLMAESLLSNGGPTAHYYANRVQQFPLALVAIAATSAVFPALQQLGHRRELAALRRLHDRTHLAIAAVALPAAVGLFVLARPVVEVSFEHGAFGPEGVERTTLALKALCFAIVPAGATGLVARTYYSVGDFSTPVKVSAAMLVLNGLLNVLFLVVLGMDVEGLAAATAVTSALNVAMLLPGLSRKLGLPKSDVPFGHALPRIVVASALSGVAAGAVEQCARRDRGARPGAPRSRSAPAAGSTSARPSPSASRTCERSARRCSAGSALGRGVGPRFASVRGTLGEGPPLQPKRLARIMGTGRHPCLMGRRRRRDPAQSTPRDLDAAARSRPSPARPRGNRNGAP